MSWPKLFANHASTLIAMLNVNKDKQIVSDSLLLLKKQAMLASNQIAASEIFIALSESFESPIKIIRANLEFIQKDVGDTKNRIKILVEQFNSLLNAQKLVHALFHEIESAPSQHSVYEIVEIATDIAKPFLTKNGIIVDYNYKDNEQSVQTVSLFGIKIQLIFALFNTIMYSISTMPEGGNISLMIDKNEESGKISIIIIDNGILTDKLGIDINNDGNLLYEIAASQQQESVLASENALPSELTQRQRQLLSLARHIITKHQGKFSAFSDEGKGTTYKITFPYI